MRLSQILSTAAIAALLPSMTIAQAPVPAATDTTTADTTKVPRLSGVEIIGRRPGSLARIPGSASLISNAQVRAQQPVSGNELLRTVPGIFLQEEEGFGLRANIGIRGLDPDRSRTVLVLEDGVPVSLAPYGEPEMYYTPPVDRMERMEIIKGSGSIMFGPQTIGGVVNYITPDAPVVPRAKIAVTGGSGGSLLAQLGYGGTWGAASANGSLLRKQARDINGLLFNVTDFTGKTGYRTAASNFLAKLSVYEENSNATYLGLTDSMFRAGSRLHPAPNDRLRLERAALTGLFEHDFSATTVLRTLAYAYRTSRDWQRQDYSYATGGNSVIFRNSTGNRDRAFQVVGVEPRITTVWSLGHVASQLDFGVRAHREHARDIYALGATSTANTGSVRDDEVRDGQAFSAFMQNRFFLPSSIELTPGLRIETFSFDRNVLRTRVRRSINGRTTNNPEDVDIRTSDGIVGVIPGIGAAWNARPSFTVFAGAHAGFAPPRTKDALIYENPLLAPDQQVPSPVSLDLDSERSWNYELGARVRPGDFVAFEATAFLLDFSNQIIEPSLSSGSVAQAALANQGRTKHRGVEAAASLDLGKAFERPYSLVVAAAGTLSDATFSADRNIQSGSSVVNVRGNRLPYAPRFTSHASATLNHPAGFVLRVDATSVGEQFTDNFETIAGSANGRTGKIPPYRVFDASASYTIPKADGLEVTASAKNMFDRYYIASRRPEGIKPGLPRLISVGLRWGM
ncbi:MAG: TonB-dependent receptor [Gemmatimonadaceae bacterium]|nr:TonB-dependent receptor [Gemmatimonadaceae bacterium]